MRDDDETKIHVRQVCLGGHTTTATVDDEPSLGRKHCPQCGKPTIEACPKCKWKLPGIVVSSGGGVWEEDCPRYCGACGEPMPWTSAKIDAADALTKELDELSAEDQKKLLEAIRDVAAEGPRKDLGAHRIKKVMAMLRDESKQMLRAFIVDVLSEVARKAVFPDGVPGKRTGGD